MTTYNADIQTDRQPTRQIIIHTIRHTHTHIQANRNTSHTYIQTDTKTYIQFAQDRETDTQTCIQIIQTGRHTDIHAIQYTRIQYKTIRRYIQTYNHKKVHTYIQTDRQTNIETGRITYKETEMQTDNTYIHKTKNAYMQDRTDINT